MSAAVQRVDLITASENVNNETLTICLIGHSKYFHVIHVYDVKCSEKIQTSTSLNWEIN